ncbi:DUF4300 family protein [Clostridium sp. CCUG 7971]|uniref:DUF4300 family protein n=1 Tax=Clostridium sp. CCUG 7971 TaxID=2811414 RepID=UPI001ABAC606|nr:DUF4300 family protein [Clostridium sp. CCUG 7971]MBO3445593.1 DUF4300 family protein [Clostridium sp. CCUG 7971]
MKRPALTIFLSGAVVLTASMALTGCTPTDSSKDKKTPTNASQSVDKKEDKAKEDKSKVNESKKEESSKDNSKEGQKPFIESDEILAQQAKVKLEKPSYKSLNYTNLVDKKTQDDVKQILSKNNIKSEYINQYFDLVNDYNKQYKVNLTNTSGFSTTDKSQVPYNGDAFQEKWLNSNKYLDVNCRISSFTLFRDFVDSKGKFNSNSSDIAQDIAALDENKLAKATKIADTNVETFKKLFSNIKVDKFGSDEEMAKLISKEFNKRGIKFTGNKDVTLINGFMRDEDLKDVYVGHAGVAVKNGDEILFIEKYTPGMPFQATKFKNKEELRSYMFDRVTTSPGGAKMPRPIVMENDHLMK